VSLWKAASYAISTRLSFLTIRPAVDQKTRIFHRHIARHLFHPLLIRMTRDSGQAYPPALQMNKKQYVVRNQPSERKHFHREEVGRHQYRHVRAFEIFDHRGETANDSNEAFSGGRQDVNSL
jgi:hypothetical protein